MQKVKKISKSFFYIGYWLLLFAQLSAVRECRKMNGAEGCDNLAGLRKQVNSYSGLIMFTRNIVALVFPA